MYSLKFEVYKNRNTLILGV